MTETPKQGARERILEAAYDLFSRRGIRDVSVDEIISRSKVAIATFYRHFSSKDQLAEAFLNRREQVWTSELIVAEAAKRSDEPVQQLLSIFDIFDEWFASEDFEGDSFVKVLLEMGPEHPLGRASIAHLNTVRSTIREIAE
ncbi:MAG TPA: helix-turn-helix domain-containing protein, partial [Microbacterium sp.]|nr:helix-turn-helix domain-containing protein [Microbacterium sp.]